MLDEGKFADAASAYQDILAEIGEPSPGGPATDLSAVLAVRANLVNAMRGRGSLGEAEREAREVLELRRVHFGADRPETLNIRQSLALVHWNRGDLARALAELEEVLATRTRVLGEDHPDTLRSLAAVADLAARISGSL